MEKKDADGDWTSRARNPHLEQAFKTDVTHLQGFPLYNLQRRLLTTDNGIPYRRRRGEPKTLLHWGQRKLLLSEIEFLTLFGAPTSPVVYAGAAPGTHVAYLSELFPENHFHLVDPNVFKVAETPRVHLSQRYFDDDLAKLFSGKQAMFISDIRTANPSTMSRMEVEKRIKTDQAWQQKWHLIMRPRKSMLKFRLPWEDGHTEYLDGDVFLPIWGPQTTTECRLIPHGSSTRKWDNRLYESQMFRFNTVIRPQCYFHGLPRGEGVDHCYDCSSEALVLAMYLLRTRDIKARDKAVETVVEDPLFNMADTVLRQMCPDYVPLPLTSDDCAKLSRSILDMSRQISRELTRGRRRLDLPQPPPGHRRLN